MMRLRGGARKAAGNPERYPHVCLLVIADVASVMAGPGALSSYRI